MMVYGWRENLQVSFLVLSSCKFVVSSTSDGLMLMLDDFGSLDLLDGSHLCYGCSTVQRQSRINFL
jgi:hypothetical protein